MCVSLPAFGSAQALHAPADKYPSPTAVRAPSKSPLRARVTTRGHSGTGRTGHGSSSPPPVPVQPPMRFTSRHSPGLDDDGGRARLPDPAPIGAPKRRHVSKTKRTYVGGSAIVDLRPPFVNGVREADPGIGFGVVELNVFERGRCRVRAGTSAASLSYCWWFGTCWSSRHPRREEEEPLTPEMEAVLLAAMRRERERDLERRQHAREVELQRQLRAAAVAAAVAAAASKTYSRAQWTQVLAPSAPPRTRSPMKSRK